MVSDRRMSQPDASLYADACQPFVLSDGAFRGRVIRLNATAQDILGRHDYPPVVSYILAESLVLCVALASGLKFDGIFTLQTSSDGPISTIVADYTSAGALRAYVAFDETALAAFSLDDVQGQSDWSPKILGTGHLAFTVDQGPDTERYQGIVPLEGGTLSDCVHTYFRQSEQLEAAVKVAVMPPSDGEGWQAGGLVVQRMPEEGGAALPAGFDVDEAWRTTVILMAQVLPQEMLDNTLDPLRLINRLYGIEGGARVSAAKPIRHSCRCSEQRIRRALTTIPVPELTEIAEDGFVVLTCEFCKTEYRVAVEELEAADG